LPDGEAKTNVKMFRGQEVQLCSDGVWHCLNDGAAA
jgi:hypothetical protein